MPGTMVVIYAILYALSFLFLHLFKYGESFYSSFKVEPQQDHEMKVIIGGDLLDPLNRQQNQENRFLNVFEVKRVSIRLFVSIAFAIICMVTLHFESSMEHFLEHLPSMLILFIVINSFYVGHLYLALLCSLMLVLRTYRPEVSIGLYAIYTFFFFTSLLVIGKRSLPTKKDVLPLVLFTLLTIILSWVFNHQFKNHSLISPLTFNLDPIKKKSLREFINHNKNQLEAGSINIPDSEKAELLSNFRELEKMMSKNVLTEAEGQLLQNKTRDVFDQLEGLNRSLTINNRAGFETTETRLSQQENEVLQGLKNMDDRDERLQALQHQIAEIEGATSSSGDQGKSAPSIQELQSLKNQAIQLTASLESENSSTKHQLTDLEKNTLTSILQKTQMDPAQQAVSDKIQKVLSEKETTETERKDLAESIVSTFQKNNPNPKEAEFFVPDEGVQQNVLNAFHGPKDKDWVLFFKRLLPLLLGLFVFVLCYHFLKKKKVKKILISSSEDLTELKEEWLDLKKRKLSPREEVILFYNFFHQALQKIHYPDHEAPPSCLIFQDMQTFNPELEKSTFIITEVFARCFYGDKDVSESHLRKFRKAISNTLKVYQIHS